MLRNLSAKGRILVANCAFCGHLPRIFVGKRPSAAGRRVRRIRRRRNRELLGGGGEGGESRNAGDVFLNTAAVDGASAEARRGSAEGVSGPRSRRRCERRRISPLAGVVVRRGRKWRSTATQVDSGNLKTINSKEVPYGAIMGPRGALRLVVLACCIAPGEALLIGPFRR